MIDISDDIDDNINEKIHVAINENQSSDFIPIVKSGWGIYEYKPVAQTLFEKQIRHSVAEIKYDKVSKSDMRPRFLDVVLDLSILLDTGAQISLWPRARFPDAQYDPSRQLQAVNGSRMATYGQRSITIRHPKSSQS